MTKPHSLNLPNSKSLIKNHQLYKTADRLILVFAQVKVLAALVCYLLVTLVFSVDFPFQLHISALQILVFGIAGIFLHNNSEYNSSPYLLSAFFLTTANAYTFAPISFAGIPGSIWEYPLYAYGYLRIDVLIAWYLWRFLERFPREILPFNSRWLLRSLKSIGLISGLIFMVIGILRCWWFGFQHLPESLKPIARLHHWEWDILIPQVLVASFFLPIKYSLLTAPERRKARLFTLGLTIGLSVAMASISFSIIFPKLSASLLSTPGRELAKISFSNFFLLTIPFTTGYAVVAQKVLDVKLIARSAVQHLLARYSATALGLLPFVFLVVFLFHNRDLTLTQLFSGNQAPVLFGASALGLAFLRFREPILDAIDRRFFRDRYNARLVLTQLAEQVRGTRNLTELSNMVGKGVDLALHLERVALLAQDPALGRFIDPLEQLRPLDPASRLATLVQSNQEPLEVDFDSPSSPLHGLAEQEKHWLVDGQVELLAPAYSLDGSMIGMLVLGGKKSDMPYLREDRDLLRSVCSAAGLVIELLFLKEKTPLPQTKTIPPSPSGRFPALPAIDPEQGATECLACSKIYPPGDLVCPNCKLELEPTLVPYVLRNQYRFEARIGTGGMAVVYRATDLRLGRTVAIKTLPRVSPDAAMRLHREARTAATVTHSGLAGIYGIETWDGVPMLVLEFLPGGTLADQLMSDEPLDTLLAIDMGQTVALALQKIHSAGILHRDIKPSNIGYTEDGHAKLLDFGVARIHHDLRQEAEIGDGGSDGDGDGSQSRVLNTASWVIGRTATGQLVGTLSYLSPEAVRGQRPDPSFDLWALAVVLWEALTGENLFIGRNYRFILDAILAVQVRDIREHLPECPEPLAEFFTRELSADRNQRAQSGLELHERLGRLRDRLLA